MKKSIKRIGMSTLALTSMLAIGAVSVQSFNKNKSQTETSVSADSYSVYTDQMTANDAAVNTEKGLLINSEKVSLTIAGVEYENIVFNTYLSSYDTDGTPSKTGNLYVYGELDWTNATSVYGGTDYVYGTPTAGDPETDEYYVAMMVTPSYPTSNKNDKTININDAATTLSFGKISGNDYIWVSERMVIPYTNVPFTVTLMSSNWVSGTSENLYSLENAIFASESDYLTSDYINMTGHENDMIYYTNMESSYETTENVLTFEFDIVTNGFDTTMLQQGVMADNFQVGGYVFIPYAEVTADAPDSIGYVFMVSSTGTRTGITPTNTKVNDQLYHYKIVVDMDTLSSQFYEVNPRTFSFDQIESLWSNSTTKTVFAASSAGNIEKDITTDNIDTVFNYSNVSANLFVDVTVGDTKDSEERLQLYSDTAYHQGLDTIDSAVNSLLTSELVKYNSTTNLAEYKLTFNESMEGKTIQYSVNSGTSWTTATLRRDYSDTNSFTYFVEVQFPTTYATADTNAVMWKADGQVQTLQGTGTILPQPYTLGAGAITGIVIGSVAVVALVGVGGYWYSHKHHLKGKYDHMHLDRLKAHVAKLEKTVAMDDKKAAEWDAKHHIDHKDTKKKK